MQNSLFVWRLLLAVFGSFALVSLLSVTLTGLLFQLAEIDKAVTFIWCMLFGFIAYSVLVIWIIATRKLLRTSAVVLLSSLSCWLFISIGSNL